MTVTAQEFQHPRKIIKIEEGEILVYGSADDGIVIGVLKTDDDFALLSGGTSKTITTAKIDISAATDNIVVTKTAAVKIHIVSITFTMSTENDITFKDGSTAISGAMPFAGTGEPKGMTMNFYPFPLIMTVNTDFKMALSNASQVSGIIQYYKE